ncbi:MAG: hypothetical protein SVS85_03120 [Candidatus Nanohaloarchaea archaeon]|nr:hypothetical protein [Candidatus Nanohaloarchaea archaeon]
MEQERIKLLIVESMVRRKQWGMGYRPIEETLSKVPKRERKEALQVIERLVQEGLAEYHKNGTCVSLVSSRREEVESYLRENGNIPGWMLDRLI